MTTVLRSPVSAADAIMLLDEYFDDRRRGHPGGGYVISRPVPENFEPPAGDFVVLYDGSDPIGCGGVRSLSPERFEIKHLYVRASTRGRGLGRVLVGELEQIAASLGAHDVVLDTNASLDAANGLYRACGYAEIAAYNDNPNATTWFMKRLKTASSHG
ncbi:GNAT family N-acetyltransferase [Paramicrobacterium chengjingii]|uniref:GNAT family N-acetyltransferase n=1 Tax=Paramicrobacterium chengjingii TaxID=2769067 RepID=A0ABX6YEG2_9MICO|nr:GNAT family N-acetyltransferase [Microbacterium chengjingii]QPZ37148.1 GNAT family N-acetyltransferase [Microbacterium chengjingii]